VNGVEVDITIVGKKALKKSRLPTSG